LEVAINNKAGAKLAVPFLLRAGRNLFPPEFLQLLHMELQYSTSGQE